MPFFEEFWCLEFDCVAAHSGIQPSDSVIVAHPDFRMFVLANRPGFPFLGNDFFGAMGETLPNIFMSFQGLCRALKSLEFGKINSRFWIFLKTVRLINFKVLENHQNETWKSLNRPWNFPKSSNYLHCWSSPRLPKGVHMNLLWLKELQLHTFLILSTTKHLHTFLTLSTTKHLHTFLTLSTTKHLHTFLTLSTTKHLHTFSVLSYMKMNATRIIIQSCT